MTDSPYWLNEWAARELGARVGDAVTLEYYLWSDGTASDAVRRLLRSRGRADERDGGDPTLVPEYPGITTPRHRRWDPPFPVDLKRSGAQDEDYWDAIAPRRRRSSPLARRAGALGLELRQCVLAARGTPPADAQSSRAVRIRSAAGRPPGSSSRGPRRWQRPRERPTSASTSSISASSSSSRRCCSPPCSSRSASSSACARSACWRAWDSRRPRSRGHSSREARCWRRGSAVGAVGAFGYGGFIMYGLRTWWVGAVGTTALALHVAAAVRSQSASPARSRRGLAALWLGVACDEPRSARVVADGRRATSRERPLRLGVTPPRNRVRA